VEEITMLKKTFQQLCAEAKTRIAETTPEAVAARVAEPGRDWVLIDVREQDEYRMGHIPGAIGCGRGILEYHIADLVPDTEKEIVLYCRGGMRSALAADSLREMGYARVESMSGGWREWAAKGLPVSDEDRMVHH
jgi:sulfur-carrier protein adenylyltransferase/sulfurtransferase